MQGIARARWSEQVADPVAGADAAPADGAARAKRREFRDEALPHLDLLFGLAIRWTGGEEDRAEDLVQETMFRAYRAWDTYENGTNCRAWLRQILRNALINDHRKRKRRDDRKTEYEENRHPPGLDEERTPATPSEHFFFRHLDDEVRAAIDALPDRFRAVLVLCDLMDHKYREAAEALEIPEGTVKSRLFRARRRLRRRLSDYAETVEYL